jgi:hypothetical protein
VNREIIFGESVTAVVTVAGAIKFGNEGEERLSMSKTLKQLK